MVGLDRVLPWDRVLPPRLQYLGIALVVLGLALDVWAAGLFTRAGTTVKPLEPSSALVTRGPFRLSRNPDVHGHGGDARGRRSTPGLARAVRGRAGLCAVDRAPVHSPRGGDAGGHIRPRIQGVQEPGDALGLR